MTHSDYIKKRDELIRQDNPYIQVSPIMQQAIDALVLQVIGDDVLPANEYSVNWTDNNLKSEQRRIVTGGKS